MRTDDAREVARVLNPLWLAALAPAGVVVGWVSSQFTIGRTLGGKFEKFLQDWNGTPERRTSDGAAILDERVWGVIETLHAHTSDIASIKKQLNGGGLGLQMTQLEGKSDELSADVGALTEDVGAMREQIAEVQRFSFHLATGQERLETKIDDTNRTLDGRMQELEVAERGHRSMLHELGMPVVDDGGDGDGG